jgi:PPOX class probable F420-dependent enzyme
MPELSFQVTPHIARRLKEELVIWLTTVSGDGTPQPNPVWFYWDGSSFLIYTPPSTAKLNNIARNPRVSLNFEGAGAVGGEVVVFTGEAKIEKSLPAQHPGYVVKYEAAAAEMGRTLEDLYAEYNVNLRVVPTKLRVS